MYPGLHLMGTGLLDRVECLLWRNRLILDAQVERWGYCPILRVINDAREYGCGTVQITASDMGVKLYSNFGFVHNENFMQYKL